MRRFPWVNRLAADYAYNFKSLAPFYAGDPATHAAWADAIARAQGFARTPAKIAAVIAAQQQQRGAPANAVKAAQRLADPRTVAVLTGQQAGLFGGPLFTLLKALTALKLADEIAHTHHVPVVAIFWIDAEDHDWNEVRSCTVLDADLTTHAVGLPAEAAAESAPVATVQLDERVVAALDELERVLPTTEFTTGLLADLRKAYAPGVGMAEAFGRWLERVLGDRGLVVYDASDPASKPLVASVFAKELSTRGDTARLAGVAGASLAAHGYHAQVQTQDGNLSLFRLDARRRPIQQQDDTFVVGDERNSPAAFAKEATDRPAGFSPNVLLRPLVQDTLFPTICYVPGPSEIAYLGQLGGVYAAFGVPMPLMYPRASATLVDSAALRFLSKYKVPLESLQAQDEAALNELLKAQIPEEIDLSVAAAASAIETAMSRVVAAMPLLDPTLERTAQSTASRMQQDLQTLQNKTIQAAKRRDDTLRRQFVRARALTFPDGHPQERAIGFVSFLNQYGPALIDRLDEELPLDLGQHWVVAI